MAKGKKTPTAIKKLIGTHKPSESLENEMSVPSIDKADLPLGVLNSFAENEWLKVTGVLSSLGMLAETDTSMLLAYCNSMGLYFEMMLKLKQDKEYVYLAPNKQIIQRAELKVGNDALSFAIKLSDKFGFNPAARTKIEMPQKKDKDIFDEL